MVRVRYTTAALELVAFSTFLTHVSRVNVCWQQVEHNQSGWRTCLLSHNGQIRSWISSLVCWESRFGCGENKMASESTMARTDCWAMCLHKCRYLKNSISPWCATAARICHILSIKDLSYLRCSQSPAICLISLLSVILADVSYWKEAPHLHVRGLGSWIKVCFSFSACLG